MTMPFSTPVAILLGGLIAGTLDIGAAALINGRSPLVILLVIASGLLGKASFQGGMPAVALGLVLQWLMSLVIAAIYVFGTNRIPELKGHWIAGGLVYGAGIFVVRGGATVGDRTHPAFHAVDIGWKRPGDVGLWLADCVLRARLAFGPDCLAMPTVKGQYEAMLRKSRTGLAPLNSAAQACAAPAPWGSASGRRRAGSNQPPASALRPRY
jgi:hypothetical protein